MLPYPLDQLDATALSEICAKHFNESGTLDFKAELTKTDDKGKNELAKDVCAMANSDGGDLVFGVREESDGGFAESISPITSEKFDEASRRILSTLDAWIEPKIRGLQVRKVDVEGGYVAVIRVPASFGGPHCVRNGNSQRRFVLRNGTITVDMSYDQIRTAFDRTATLAEKARQLIDQRLALVAERRTPRPMEQVPICAAEFVPFSGLSGRAKVDVAKLRNDNFEKLALPIWRDSSVTRTLNLDGLIVHPNGGDSVNAMTHVFRDGRFETLQIGGGEGQQGRKLIWSKVVTDFMTEATRTALRFAQTCEMSGPAILCFALMHIDDYEFAIKENFHRYRPPTADRSALVFPEIWIEEVSANVDIAELVAPTIEILWQAFDFAKAHDQG
jgi:hypothetical protein